MYQDETYDKAVKEAQIEGLKELKQEVKSIEKLIERLLTQLLECSSSVSERDFNVCSL
jgi:peptidoglycan hydrolase CwlO-like protein